MILTDSLRRPFASLLALKLILTSSPVLAQSSLDLPAMEAAPITVTAKPRPSSTLTTPASVSVVQGRQLERERKQTLVESIQAPGVSAVTTGAGIAKPVVRGLSSQRVLILTDGVRQEGQQWGDEHGPEIDAHDLDRVEVVRGPQSLLYGPEALGGVINAIRRPLPTEGDAFAFGGNLSFDAFSHNDQAAGSLDLRGGGRGAGFALKSGRRTADDLRTPIGRLRNSGLKERDHRATAGVKGGWGSVTLDASHFDQRLQIHEDPRTNPTATPFQQVEHDKVRLHAEIPAERLRFEVSSAWQKNRRREFEAKDDLESALRLVLNTFTTDLKVHHEGIGPVKGTLGFYGMGQKNDTQADEKLIPGFTAHDLGTYFFEELPLGDVTLSAGARYDARRMFVKQEGNMAVAAQTLKYQSLSSALGATWVFSPGWALASNFGTGWRAPSAFELFVNGEHEGSNRFEVGRSDLRPERSVNFDVALRRSTERIQAEAALFHNRINHFIFARPTGGVDAGSGLSIFNIAQANATLIGGEVSLKARLCEKLQASAGVDFVRARNEDLNEPLPQMPPQRFSYGLRWNEPAAGPMRNAYASIQGRVSAEQKRVASNETTTAGYGLVDLGLGAEIPFSGGAAHLDIGLENAFDQPYRDHLSRYRAFALNAGRSFTLRLSVPFGNL